MSNTDERRWQQRLDNFSKALSQLEEACEQDSYTNLERAGLIQTFVFSYELGWNVLKDLLFYEGFDLHSPREVIRKGFEMQYLDEEDCESFLDAVSRRNILSHTYREEVAREAEDLIKNRYYPTLRRLRGTLEEKRAK